MALSLEPRARRLPSGENLTQWTGSSPSWWTPNTSLSTLAIKTHIVIYEDVYKYIDSIFIQKLTSNSMVVTLWLRLEQPTCR